MNKHLLTLAGIISLLAVDQAFCSLMHRIKIKKETARKKEAPIGSWSIKNETATDQTVTMRWTKDRAGSMRMILSAGQTWSDTESREWREAILHQVRSGNAVYIPKRDKDGKLINPPLKNLTIKTVDGKTVIVENP